MLCAVREQEKHFTLLTYQSVLEKLDNVTDLEIKQRLYLATRDAGQVWQVLQENSQPGRRD